MKKIGKEKKNLRSDMVILLQKVKVMQHPALHKPSQLASELGVALVEQVNLVGRHLD
jgi:hypothetical protein